MVGASPNFSEVHVLRALFLILEKERIGRKKLVRILGIGEGSVRTLLKKLKSDGLILSKENGHYLTEKGIRKIKLLLKKISRPKTVDFPKDVLYEKSLITIRNSADKVSKGLEERDIAVREGAIGAILLTYENNKLNLPPQLRIKDLRDIPIDEFDCDPSLDFKDKDLVIITFADTYMLAENAALAIGLNLM